MVLRAPPDDRSIPALLEFGVINLDKPAGPSAHQVAAWTRDLVVDTGEVAIEQAGHAGTLDPKVTGCLPMLLGVGTRCVPALQGAAKTYIAVLELHREPPSSFEAVLKEFEGEVYQRPPKKSAVDRRLRTRTIHDLTVIEQEGRQALLRIRCEAGTYIRKLCHHLGLALGTGAHMGDLRRVAVGPFDDTKLHTLQALMDGLVAWQDEGKETWLREVVAPAEAALTHLPRVRIAESAAREVANGAPVYAPGVLEVDAAVIGDLVACYTPNGAVVCLGELVADPSVEEGTVVSLERVLV